MLRQWRLDLEVSVRKWRGLEMFVRWIGSRGTGSRCAVTKIVCLRNGRWHLRRFLGLDWWRIWWCGRWPVANVLSIVFGKGRRCLNVAWKVDHCAWSNTEGSVELVVIFFYGWKNLVQQGAFRNDPELLRDQGMKKWAGQDPMRVGWIKSRSFESSPVFATAYGRLWGGPVNDCLLVIAELFEDSCMFDENHLEGWCMAWNLMGKNL